MNWTKPVTFLCALALFAAPVLAGPLASDTNAIVGFHGSTGYQGYYDFPGTSQPSGLVGHIDYAVYTAANYPAGFTGYVPTPGQYVYTYQAYQDIEGPAPLSQFILAIENAANNPGTFTGDGGFGPVAPTSLADIPDDIQLVAWIPSNGASSAASRQGMKPSDWRSPARIRRRCSTAS